MHAVALDFMYYNFARVHQTLKCTPAMAAGLENANGKLATSLPWWRLTRIQTDTLPTGGYIGGLRRRFRAAGQKTSADELNPMPPTPYAPPSQNPHFPRNRSHASPAFFPRRNPLQANHFQPAPPNRHTVSAHPPR